VSRELYVVCSGIVELTVEDAVAGGDTVISIRQRGELCGELSFFFGRAVQVDPIKPMLKPPGTQ